ncbi:ketoacyl-ACP synthase III [Herbiconiux moechotypicola]|uniref:Ketoacyl-ACP synthase III n=1 Tax=Herbiconiux moechotypicola TaxID=637393 RepID=A0ABN3DNG7_9MICO|nr:3-oxoacyl-[acyl-carrier-protein] synthase III C-terminal domain-containing protein [Herbiconiux moechotypicola]MCS5730367.1 ketoacyl-ACP synthase III [Herbiconiux moechotypicola]
MSAARIRARLADVETFLPPVTRSADETEQCLRAENPDLKLPTGLIARLTGVDRVHLRPEGWQTSDLAAAAARPVAERAGGPVDLLLFASASQDLIEPATSHIVASKLGLDCPVMDVKNACNSVINAMEVATALIESGRYRRVLVASGEQPSHAVRWRLDGREQFLRSFAGYTMSDAGAAVLLEASEASEAAAAPAGVLGSRFVARSEHWQVGTLPTGGSVNPHAVGGSYFDMDGAALQRAFARVGVGLVQETLDQLGIDRSELDFVAIHQVAAAYHGTIVEALGVDVERTLLTVAEHGNLASVTLPLQLRLALDRGLVGEGSLVALIGLAGGISLGAMVVRL